MSLRERWWPRPGERLLPALSALLLAASYPPLHPLVLPFVGLVPLAVWMHRLPPGSAGREAAQRGALVFGSLYFGLVFYWVLVALVWFTALAIPAFAAALGLIVVVTVAFLSLFHRAVHCLSVPIWLALPVVWTGLEWVRAHLPDTLAFPWLGLGTSLTAFPEIVGIAEIVGARGVTFWLALVNGLLAAAVIGAGSGAGGRLSPVGWRRPLVVAALVVTGPVVWGVWRAGTLEMRSVGQVAVLQPNIAEHLKLDAEAGRDSTFAALDRLMPTIAPSSVRLAVMPEMTLPIAPRSGAFGGETARLQSYAREIGAPVLFGAYGFEETPDGYAIPYNSAFLMEPQGLTDFQYDKRRLVPVVERVPFVPAALFGGFEYLGIYGKGTSWTLAEVDDVAWGVMICFESVFADAGRALRAGGADVLVNITNDAWYGREPLYSRTTALWQHPAHLVMRAIETRAGVARAANTGISLFVDPVGRIHQPTALFEETVATGEVFTTDETTLFVRYGDVVGTLCALIMALLAVWSWFEARRSRSSLDPPSQVV